MHQHGKLCRWNAERGFGFIKPDAGGSDVFVHITAFPRAAGIPVIGDSLTYDIDIRDGKPQAIDIQTTRVSYSQPQLKRKKKVTRQSESSFGEYVLAALLLVLIVFVYWKFFQRPHSNAIDSEQTTQAATPKTDAEIRQAIRDSLTGNSSQPASKINSSKKPISSSNFTCDGRKHCSQMTSCAEATYFLQHCPGVQMDGGNRDGVPCESQWCGED